MNNTPFRAAHFSRIFQAWTGALVREPVLRLLAALFLFFFLVLYLLFVLLFFRSFFSAYGFEQT